jgi:hypothetical protein
MTAELATQNKSCVAGFVVFTIKREPLNTRSFSLLFLAICNASLFILAWFHNRAAFAARLLELNLSMLIALVSYLIACFGIKAPIKLQRY